MTELQSSLITISELIKQSRVASLGTNHPSGIPFVTLVTVARFTSHKLVMLLSGLAQHTRNLKLDSRCSLLIVGHTQSSGNPMTAQRVTLSGQAAMLDKDNDSDARASYLKNNPDAAIYADLGDFSIFCMEIEEAHLVAGFGRIQTIPREHLRDLQ